MQIYKHLFYSKMTQRARICHMNRLVSILLIVSLGFCFFIDVNLPKVITGFEQCDTGVCADCNNECFYNTTGLCHHCWTKFKVETEDFVCLSENFTQPSCMSYWNEAACQLCDHGSCAKCKPCASSKVGNCSLCWKSQSGLPPCLTNGHEGCGLCWNASSPPLVIVPGLTSSFLNVSSYYGSPQ